MTQNEIKINVSEKIIEDTLVSALEGGSDYWMEMRGLLYEKPARDKGKLTYLPSYITTPLSKNGGITLLDKEDNQLLELYRYKIMQGIKVMSEKYPRHFGDMIAENGDATTGDVFLQCALFGEIKYG